MTGTRSRNVWPTVNMRHWAYVLAALLAVVTTAPSPSRADDFIIRTIVDRGASMTMEGEFDLSSLATAIREQLGGAIRQAAPELFQDRDVVTLRYRTVNAQVAEVQFELGGNSHEIRARTRVSVHADRERRVLVPRGFHTTFEWRADGPADVAAIEFDGRITVALQDASTLTAHALLDQIRVQVQLELLNGISLTHPMNGRDVGSRTFPPVSTGDLPPGTQITSYGVTAVTGMTARVRLELAFPASSALVSDGGVPTDAGP